MSFTVTIPRFSEISTVQQKPWQVEKLVLVAIAITTINTSHTSNPTIYKGLKAFWLSNWSNIARVAAFLFEVSLVLPVLALQRLMTTRKYPVFVLARPTRQSGPEHADDAWPEELGNLYCTQKLCLEEPLVVTSDGQLTDRELKLGIKREFYSLTNEL